MRKFIFGKVATEVPYRIRREDPDKKHVNGKSKLKPGFENGSVSFHSSKVARSKQPGEKGDTITGKCGSYTETKLHPHTHTNN